MLYPINGVRGRAHIRSVAAVAHVAVPDDVVLGVEVFASAAYPAQAGIMAG